MKRRALVTGATGYIGSKLCERLFSDGWTVGVLVRNAGRSLPPTLASGVTLHNYDGSTDSVLVAVRDSKPDIVFHLASLFIAEHRSENVIDLISSNVLYGTQLLEACVNSEVKYFINTGTSWQHYRSDHYDPVCLYAATKQAFEDIVDYYTAAFPLRAITLKIFDTYGPDDPRPKLVNILLKTLATGETLDMSPGDQALDFVHISDVIKAFTCCANELFARSKTLHHQRYALSSQTTVSIKELVALFESISGKKLNINFGARPYRRREVMAPWKAGARPPDWSPLVKLDVGLAELLNQT